MTLSGKIAVVTGAARGIGRGCALELARAGADIVLNDRELSPQLQAAAAEIRALGRRCELAPADAFDRAGCEEIVQRAVTSLGRIDCLISNPAYSRRGDFLTFDAQTFEQVVRGTLLGGFHLGQLVARHMSQRGEGGKMVFISSVHASQPYARSCAYNAAKSGLNHLARSMAAELAASRINVNVIEPGWIDTPGERETFGDEYVAREGARLPWGRLGRPEEIGKAAAFLCSADADYITGAVLPVDGGFLLRGALG